MSAISPRPTGVGTGKTFNRKLQERNSIDCDLTLPGSASLSWTELSFRQDFYLQESPSLPSSAHDQRRQPRGKSRPIRRHKKRGDIRKNDQEQHRFDFSCGRSLEHAGREIEEGRRGGRNAAHAQVHAHDSRKVIRGQPQRRGNGEENGAASKIPDVSSMIIPRMIIKRFSISRITYLLSDTEMSASATI